MQRELKERYKENEKKHVERMRRKIQREIVQIYRENEKKDVEKISNMIYDWTIGRTRPHSPSYISLEKNEQGTLIPRLV